VRGKISSPTCIGILGIAHIVLAAIKFDAKLKRRTIEVERVGADRMLAPEMQPIDLIATQCSP
jgi:hypothetical protein